jgi:large subunit ribosomal protein L7/L12
MIRTIRQGTRASSSQRLRTAAQQQRQQPAVAARLYHTSLILQQTKVNKLFERMMWLDVVEINMLNDEIQKRLGMNVVHADTLGGGGAGAAGAGGGEEAAAVEEKTTFDLKLLAFDAKSKIKVIKEVRAIAGLGLKEAKELVEGAPKIIKKDLKEDEANELKAKLEEVGAQVEVS